MRADGTFRIAYLGPSKGGKSMLLTGITDCTALGTHGYPPDLTPRIERVNPQAANSPPSGQENTSLLERYKEMISRPPGVGGLDSDLDHTRGGDGVRATQSVKRLHGKLTYRQKNGQTETQLFDVLDSPGERFFEARVGGQVVNDGIFDEEKTEILTDLASAQALVFAIAFSQLSNRAVSTGLKRILSFLAEERRRGSANGEPPAKDPFRVVIALTRYDALFLHLGSLAFEAASEPEVAAYAIQKALKPHREAYYPLTEFDTTHASGIFDIRFVPTSAFGFLPRFGCPNIDPDQPDESEVRQGKSPNLFWEDSGTTRTVFPFLTADPFIFAMTGIESDFLVKLPKALDVHAARLGRTSPTPLGTAGADAAGTNGKARGADRKSEKPKSSRGGGSLWKGIKGLVRELLR